MVHTPDCASLHKVRAIPWQGKMFNATLIGYAWEPLYPLRHTMELAIGHRLIHGGEKMPHPGCGLAKLACKHELQQKPAAALPMQCHDAAEVFNVQACVIL